MIFNNKGISITLEYDEDGFPEISIDMGGGYFDDNGRPTVAVNLDGVEIHSMFKEDDFRWKET